MKLKIFSFICLLVIFIGVVYYFNLTQHLRGIFDLQDKKFFELSDLLLFFLPLLWLLGILILIGAFVAIFKETIYDDLEFVVIDYVFGWSWNVISLPVNLMLSIVMGILSGINQQSLVFGLFITCLGSLLFSFAIILCILRQTCIKWYNA